MEPYQVATLVGVIVTTILAFIRLFTGLATRKEQQESVAELKATQLDAARCTQLDVEKVTLKTELFQKEMQEGMSRQNTILQTISTDVKVTNGQVKDLKDTDKDHEARLRYIEREHQSGQIPIQKHLRETKD